MEEPRTKKIQRKAKIHKYELSCTCKIHKSSKKFFHRKKCNEIIKYTCLWETEYQTYFELKTIYNFCARLALLFKLLDDYLESITV